MSPCPPESASTKPLDSACSLAQKDMDRSDRSVFVYGTLKPGGTYWPDFCEGKVDKPVPAKIRGKLYDLNVGYPGLKLTGDHWVHGFILKFQHEEDLLRVDYLEGYEPGRPASKNEYNRVKVPCFTLDCEELGAHWAYEMTDRTVERLECTLIPSGIWEV